jgi:dehydrogenase/reductase SDR family protein 7
VLLSSLKYLLADYYAGKVVWITGASSGIGEALAKELVISNNIKLVISARRKDELERVKKECLGK